MRKVALAVCLVSGFVVAACGGSSEGILVSVTKDATSVPGPIDHLHFVIGVQQADGTFLTDATHPDEIVDVSDRDLASKAYRLLLADSSTSGTPSTIMVGVIGLRAGVEVAFDAFAVPQPFMPGKTVERDLVLHAATPGTDYTATATGCLAWGSLTITSRDDRDCDGDPTATDCNDMDPAINHMATEMCGNAVDENCNMMIDEGCGECTDASMCDALHGAPPCGSWTCPAGTCLVSCPGCTDMDGDGYGVETVTGACAGPDCDDADPTIHDSGARSCYDGPDSTVGVGTCRAGSQVCTAGKWTACQGEVVPTGESCDGEDDDCNGAVDDNLGTFTCGVGACAMPVAACTGGTVGTCPLVAVAVDDSSCNGIDDDCDGAIDEDCPCVRVSAAGDDMNAVLDMNVTPFATVQAAIDWAAITPTAPSIVCVAPGDTCGVTHVFQGAIVMKDGISVYGGYEDVGWTRCANDDAATILRTNIPEGVAFPPAVVNTTVLDGVSFERQDSSSATAAVTVNGAHNVILSHLVVNDFPSSPTVMGVNIVNDGDALVTQSAIAAGDGGVLSVGVRATNSRVTVLDNCAQIDTGHCVVGCGVSGPAIRGRMSVSPGGGAGESYGVKLTNSPGSQIAESAVCSANQSAGAAIRIEGDGAGDVIRGNFISAFGGVNDSHGIWAEDCNDAAPWIVDNAHISAQGAVGANRVDAVRAIGSCHPVIDSNQLIIGGQEGMSSSTTAVHCGANAGGTPSLCAVIGNAQIEGSTSGFPPSSVGVRCDNGSCVRIADNNIGGVGGVDVVGLLLDKTGALVERNVIVGGCGTTSSRGIFAKDAWSRVQNNLIGGGRCNTGTIGGTTFVGVDVVNGPTLNEIHLHSNTIDGGGYAGSCTSAGLRVEVGTVPPPGDAPLGIYRNDILFGGLCGVRYDVQESSHNAEPRIFENNDLLPMGMSSALYLDEGGMLLTTAAAVNALTDMTVSGVISADPLFVSSNNLHLTASSPCRDAGTTASAPLDDMDRQPRSDGMPDIGADEF